MRASYETRVIYFLRLICLSGGIYAQHDPFFIGSASLGYDVEEDFGISEDMNWYWSFQNELQLFSSS